MRGRKTVISDGPRLKMPRVSFRRRRTVETHTSKVFVQQLHVSVDNLEGDELIVLLLDGAAEIQAGVSANRTEQGSKFEALTLTV